MLRDVRWHPPVAVEIDVMERLLASINETSEALRVGRTSVYSMLSDGRLEAIKVGRRRLVKVESIRRLIEAQG
jgi:excisionase family DNA binding protein